MARRVSVYLPRSQRLYGHAKRLRRVFLRPVQATAPSFDLGGDILVHSSGIARRPALRNAYQNCSPRIAIALDPTARNAYIQSSEIGGFLPCSTNVRKAMPTLKTTSF